MSLALGFVFSEVRYSGNHNFLRTVGFMAILGAVNYSVGRCWNFKYSGCILESKKRGVNLGKEYETWIPSFLGTTMLNLGVSVPGLNQHLKNKD